MDELKFYFPPPALLFGFERPRPDRGGSLKASDRNWIVTGLTVCAGACAGIRRAYSSAG